MNEMNELNELNKLNEWIDWKCQFLSKFVFFLLKKLNQSIKNNQSSINQRMNDWLIDWLKSSSQSINQSINHDWLIDFLCVKIDRFGGFYIIKLCQKIKFLSEKWQKNFIFGQKCQFFTN